jgi:hypothetical protein
MLVISFESSQEEKFEYARVDNRLVVVRHVEEQNNSGAGESGQQRSTAILTFSH